MQPFVDFLLAALEGPQDAGIFGKYVPLAACATNHGSVALRDKFNTIALLQTKAFADWLGNRDLAFAGDDASVDIPFHEVRIALLTYVVAAN